MSDEESVTLCHGVLGRSSIAAQTVNKLLVLRAGRLFV